MKKKIITKLKKEINANSNQFNFKSKRMKQNKINLQIIMPIFCESNGKNQKHRMKNDYLNNEKKNC